jgi:KDO2-lipid IV(A) lauroyltransferase
MNLFFSYIGYGFLKMLSFLPLRILYIFSDLTYFLVYRVIGYRKKVVTQNMMNSFPEMDPKELIRTRNKFYHHFCDLFLETIKIMHISEREIKKRCFFKNPELLQQYSDDGESVIAIMGHYGNWEWMTSYALWSDTTFLPIYKPLHNKVFDRMYINLRERFGAETLPKQDTLRRMIRYKNQNTPTITAFIGDQTPNKKNIQYWTQFLNQDTPIFMGTEKIAQKLNQVVVFVNMQKVKRGYYEVEFIPLFEQPKDTAPFEITEKHTRKLEEIIQKQPAYWLWSHKRWKHKRDKA